MIDPVMRKIVNYLRAYLAFSAGFVLKCCSPLRIKKILNIFRNICTPATIEEVQGAQEMLIHIFPRITGPRNCLHYSLATTLYLILQNKFPTWCVGVKNQPPFLAHAWVEVDATIIGDDIPSSALSTLVVIEPKEVLRTQ